MKKFLNFADFLRESEETDQDDLELPDESSDIEKGESKEEFEDKPKEPKKDVDAQEFGCAMVLFDFPQLKEIQDQINDEDVYREDRKGLVKDAHVTLLYGFIDEEVDPEAVLDDCEKGNFTTIKLSDLSLFENEKFDVLKLKADAAFLKTLNGKLRKKYAFENEYNEYSPHCTIAYLKKGTGQGYLDSIKLEEEEFEVTPTDVAYTFPGRDKLKRAVEVKEEEEKGEEAPAEKKDKKIMSKDEFEKSKEKPVDDLELPEPEETEEEEA
jgi:2'-5' RNA ligase